MSISRNAVYNVLGAVLPSVLTLVTVPAYLYLIGVDRFGVLTLCWVIIGYAGVLDVGLGLAAATKIAALREQPEDASAVFWTTGFISLVIGLVGGLVMYVGATLYFEMLADGNPELRVELEGAAPMLALMVPLAMINGVLAGALTGRERFLLLNIAAAFAHSLTAAMPLLVAYLWTTDLRLLIASLFLARILPMPFLYAVCRRVVPLRRPTRPSWGRARELISFGGWTSLLLTASSIMQTVDRLLIGSRIGPGAVPIYTIPYGLISRVNMIPHSLSAALYPRYAYVDEEEAKRLNANSIVSVAVIITPALIGLLTVAEPFFTLWIGAQLAEQALPVAYILAGGFWIYCIGHMAYSMLQAGGRPDLVSKVLMAEILPYALLIVLGLWAFGVIGAAVAFTTRALVDSLIFLRLARVPWRTVRSLWLPAALTLAAILAASFIPGLVRYLILAGLLAAAIAWSLLNLPDSLKPHLARFAAMLPRRPHASGR